MPDDNASSVFQDRKMGDSHDTTLFQDDYDEVFENVYDDLYDDLNEDLNDHSKDNAYTDVKNEFKASGTNKVDENHDDVSMESVNELPTMELEYLPRHANKARPDATPNAEDIPIPPKGTPTILT